MKGQVLSDKNEDTNSFSFVKGPAEDAKDAPQQMLRTHRSLEAYCATL
jgi:hypothetical protein